MSEQTTDLSDPKILRRTAEHLTDRYSGVFFPELVERCVAQCHVSLARTARIRAYLAPMAVHDAATRLAALARAKGSASAPVRQVLFVDGDDTGPAQIAAVLLAHHAGRAVVTRSAGTDPGTAVDPYAVEILAQYGADPAEAAPKPVTEAVVRAADWIITLGPQRPGPLPADAVSRIWPVQDPLDGERGPAVVADLEARTQALWAEITSPSVRTS